jgi:hypothetical protein
MRRFPSERTTRNRAWSIRTGLACLLLPAACAVSGEFRLQALAVLDMTNQGGLMEPGEEDALSDRFRVELAKTGLWDIADHAAVQKFLAERGVWPVTMLQELRESLPGFPAPPDSGRVAFAEVRKVDRYYTLTGYLLRWKDGSVVRAENEDAVCPFETLVSVHVPRLARKLSGIAVPENGPGEGFPGVFRPDSPHPAAGDSAASIRVTSDPEGVAVTVDGLPFGRTPASIAGLGPGWHTLRLSGEHYTDWIESFSLKPAAADTLHRRMVPLRGFLFAESEIPNSLILVDGQYSGYTPRVVPNLASGLHRVEISRPRMKPFAADVEIAEGRTFRLMAVQTRAALRVDGETEGAAIRLDGKPVTAVPGDTTAVRPGDYTLTAGRKGYETIRIPLSIEPLETERVRLLFQPRSRGKAVGRAFLIPGWGQLYAQRPVRGFLALAAEAALIGGAVAADRRMASFDRGYDHAVARYRAAVDADDITAARGRMARKYDDIRDSESARNALIGSAAGVWIAGIIDAVWYHPPCPGRSGAGLRFDLPLDRPRAK